MRLFLCSSSAALGPPRPPPPTYLPTPAAATSPMFNNFSSVKTKLISAALSLGLLLGSPPSLAVDLDSSINQLKPYGGPPIEDCLEDEQEEREEVGAQVVTNESIVEEAWEIVNDSFLDAGRRRWSPEMWQAIYRLLLFSQFICICRLLIAMMED